MKRITHLEVTKSRNLKIGSSIVVNYKGKKYLNSTIVEFVTVTPLKIAVRLEPTNSYASSIKIVGIDDLKL